MPMPKTSESRACPSAIFRIRVPAGSVSDTAKDILKANVRKAKVAVARWLLLFEVDAASASRLMPRRPCGQLIRHTQAMTTDVTTAPADQTDQLGCTEDPDETNDDDGTPADQPCPGGRDPPPMWWSKRPTGSEFPRAPGHTPNRRLVCGPPGVSRDSIAAMRHPHRGAGTRRGRVTKIRAG
jgi:hypothetical protein